MNSINTNGSMPKSRQDNPYIKPSAEKPITTLVLGSNQNTHVITKKDRFLDNGVCVQLLKEIPMTVQYAGDSLALDDEAIKTIARFQQITHRRNEYTQQGHGISFRVFSIVSDEERFLVMGYPTSTDEENKEGIFLGGEGYYKNALALKENNEINYFKVKIFDTDKDEVNH